MFNRHGIHSALILAMLFALLGPQASTAENFQDRDTREITSYVLTEAGLTKYIQATKNLDALAKKIHSDCDADDEAKSLNDFVARVNAIPGVQAAVQSAGMTTREYVVFMFSLFQNGMAAWALDQPGGKLPPDVSKANVDFYKKHTATIQKMAGPKKSDDCDDDRSEDRSNDGSNDGSDEGSDDGSDDGS